MHAVQLRVGLVGGGPWAWTVHAPTLANHPRTQLAGVWTRRAEIAGELAAAFGTRAYTDLDTLIADVEAVAFAVPPAVQGELALRAAAAGRHLICEKPVAETLPAARALVEQVRVSGVVTSVVLTLRYDDAVRAWLSELPDPPAAVDTVGLARWLSGALLGGPFAASQWRAERGALLDIGPHVFDLLDTALGAIDDVEWAHHAEPDLWRVGLRHAGGARSTSTLSLRVPVDPSEIEFLVVGGAGRHRFAGRAADAPACYARLLDEFTAAIAGKGSVPTLDVARGLRLQEIVDAAQRAAGQLADAEPGWPLRP